MTSPGTSVIPADTSPDVWRVQMRALGVMTMQQRLALWEQLNDEFAAMEEASVRRQHPEYSEEEVRAELVCRRLGAELARAAWPHLTRVHGT